MNFCSYSTVGFQTWRAFLGKTDLINYEGTGCSGCLKQILIYKDSRVPSWAVKALAQKV